MIYAAYSSSVCGNLVRIQTSQVAISVFIATLKPPASRTNYAVPPTNKLFPVTEGYTESAVSNALVIWTETLFGSRSA